MRTGTQTKPVLHARTKNLLCKSKKLARMKAILTVSCLTQITVALIKMTTKIEGESKFQCA